MPAGLMSVTVWTAVAPAPSLESIPITMLSKNSAMSVART